jgi:hypothetical protein
VRRKPEDAKSNRKLPGKGRRYGHLQDEEREGRDMRKRGGLRVYQEKRGGYV